MSVHLSSWGGTEAPKAFAVAEAACKYLILFPPVQETADAQFVFSEQTEIAFPEGDPSVYTEGWHTFQPW